MQLALEKGLTDEAMEKFKRRIKDVASDLESDMDYSIKESLAGNLVYFVEEMAKGIIKALLAGDEKQMRRYLMCDGYCARSDDGYTRPWSLAEAHPAARIEEGREAEPIRLRRSIVEAHRDLIISERIKDLEDQVRSLVAQVKAGNAQARR